VVERDGQIGEQHDVDVAALGRDDDAIRLLND